jgi:D-glycero-alpha-D-manno-heptose 1-phosphate guanylyltransferase
MQDKPHELIVLCGGEGSRLRPVLPETPKLLAPVGEKTFLDFLLTFFRSQGINRFLFCTGYLGSKIGDFMLHNYPEIPALFIQEETALGTGGAIRHALPYSIEEQVLVTNGDTLHLTNLNTLWDKHRMANAVCTMQCAYVSDVSRYGTISWNEEDRVLACKEKGKTGAGWINAGTYLINKEMFLKKNPPVRFSFENDFLPDLVRDESLWITRQEGYFLDIGIPEDYQRAQIEIPANVK